MNGATANHADAAQIVFGNSATAGHGTFTLHAGTVSGAGGGLMIFNQTAGAGSATLIANGGSGMGSHVSFFGDSTGGTARVEVFGDASMDIGSHNAPGLTVGSVIRFG